MSQFEQDVNGDILITNNRFTLVSGTDEIRQRLAQNLQTFLEEVFTDKTLGVPWTQIIFQKGTPPSVIEGLLKNEILKTQGVSGLNRFEPLDLTPETRVLNVDFGVDTQFGPIDVGVTL